jgi:hypothetical protein
VETIRVAYLPEVVRQQQDAVNVERLHRFAAVVRYADTAATRRQACLNVQVMALNSSPSRAAGSRTRLREAARLIAEIAELRMRQAELGRQWCALSARLLFAREKLPRHAADTASLRRRIDDLLAGGGIPHAPAETGKALPPALPQGVEGCLKEAEDARREARLLADDIEAAWSLCEKSLDEVGDSVGASACLSLDSLIVELADQVHSLQRLVAWLLALTFVVLLIAAHFVHRRVVSPILACARSANGGQPASLPERASFREIHDISDALQGSVDISAPDPKKE